MRVFTLLILCLLILSLTIVPAAGAGRQFIVHHGGYGHHFSSLRFQHHYGYHYPHYSYRAPVAAQVYYVPAPAASTLAGDAVREEIRKVIREELQKALRAPAAPEALTTPPKADPEAK